MQRLIEEKKFKKNSFQNTEELFKSLNKMNYTETDLYIAIKNNNLTKLIEILRRYNLTKYEFFNNKITFISLAVISSKFKTRAQKIKVYIFKLYLKKMLAS